MKEEPKASKETGTPTIEALAADVDRAKRRLSEAKSRAIPYREPETSLGARAIERQQATAPADTGGFRILGDDAQQYGGAVSFNDDANEDATLDLLIRSSGVPEDEIEAIKRYFEFGTVSDTVSLSIHVTAMLIGELSKGNQIIIQDKKGARKALVIELDETESK
jgi:hypothetical protein